MISLARPIVELIDREQPFALAAILSHKGSTPRTSGSRMLVRSDRSIEGTIGGGLVEARVMDACLAMLDKNRSTLMEFALDKALKSGMDMVCGGSLTVWLRSFVPPFSAGLGTAFQELTALQASGGKAVWVTRIDKDTPADPCLVTRTGTAPLLPRSLLARIQAGEFPGPGPVLETHDLAMYMIEPLQPRDRLYIFGAGHVGFQLGQMAPGADFSVTVIDDREEFANARRFPHADRVKVAAEFASAFDGLDVNENTYIVILTRGHLHDQTVLAQALKTRAGYIGMIGSRKKRDQIYGNLREQGVSEDLLARVHSPIGLAIGAQTPAEIAVSIMAELIRERAGLAVMA